MKNLTYKTHISLLFFSLAYNVQAAVAEESSRNTFIDVGLGTTFSNNVYKTLDNQINGTSTTADVEFDYNRQKATNTINFNYQAEYSIESEEELQDGIDWSGQAKVSQQVYSKNLIFDLEHIHQGYLLDQSQPDISTNNNDKDLLTLGMYWVIPYSQQSSFILSAAHTETWFTGSNSASDSSSNEAGLDWDYKINNKAQIEINSSATSSKFDDFDSTYYEYSLGSTYTQLYRLGSYSLAAGQTWTDGLNEVYSGWYYTLNIDAEFSRHLLSFISSRELTNSSSNFGDDESITFNQNVLYWYTYASLEHQYKMKNDKVTHSIRFYFERNDELISVEDTSDFKDVIDKYGVSGQLTWKITEQLSSSLSASYYQSDLANDSLKKFADTELSAQYNFNSSFYIQLIAAYEIQNSIDEQSGYNEQSYTARIAYRFY